jgi:hypothetical protein
MVLPTMSRAACRRSYVLAASVLWGCAQAPAALPSEDPGTRRMAGILAEIATGARETAQNNAFLNRERVALMRQTRRPGDGLTPDFAFSQQLADELLKAGDTREAIVGLEEIVTGRGLSWDSIAPADKPLFDLLALAYLRLGEQQNCAENSAANICILPLRGGARHVRQEGARGAITRYTALRRQFPSDRGAQWLLNLAVLQIGGWPDSLPVGDRVPGMAPVGPARFPEYPNVARAVGLDHFGQAGGLSVDDFNGDGFPDVFATAWGFSDAVRVMINDGRGGFADRGAAAGLAGITGGLNVIQADYDNDGDLDVVVLRGAWQGEGGQFPFSLLRNRGDATFDDVTSAAGVFSLVAVNSASWADLNLDVYVDLFVGYESYSKLNGTVPRFSKLFVNNRNGTFTERAADVGLAVDEFVKGVTWGDVNNDGLPDLYLSILFGENKLFMNRGGAGATNWRFEEVAAAAGVTKPRASFPTWFWDVDNDGFDDLLVASYDLNAQMHEMVAREFLGLPLTATDNGVARKAETSKLYRNRGDGTFEDVSARMGLADKAMYAMGSNFGDLDNDGYLDMYFGTGNPDLRSVIPNRMFRNLAGRGFEEVTLPGGFGHLQKGHATAFADLDRDGDQDVLMIMGGAYEGDLSSSVLFENPGWKGTHWVTLLLQGTTANRSAIGARVAIDVADRGGARRTIRRTVNSGGSFGAGPLQVHVGLGTAERIERVRVQWPDRARTTTSSAALAMDSHYRIVQGAEPVRLSRPPIPFRSVAPSGRPAMKMPGM